MITGDNPRTAAAIAHEAGVDDFLAEATPEAKMKLIQAEQALGKLVAMTGDGTNDAPALAQADVGMAMNTGTQAAKEAGNMIDLDSDPTKLLGSRRDRQATADDPRRADDVFDRQRRGQVLRDLAGDVHGASFPEMAPLNVMQLATPHSAILSAVIFNAIIIIMLIPLALRGVTYRPIGAGAAAAKTAVDLRRRRRDRAVRRHQADRHGPGGRAPDLR